MSAQNENRPDVFTFEDYRLYLRERVAFERTRGRGFSYRNFVKASGINSTGFLSMVLSGKRNLSPGSISEFSRVLGHNRRESDYFEALVLCNQSKTEKEREYYRERVQTLRPKTKQALLDLAKYEYFTKSYYVIIREMVALPDFQEDPEWIAERMHPKIKPAEAQEALRRLSFLGLIAHDANGRMVQVDRVVSTPATVAAFEIYAYHAQMLQLAKDALVKGDPRMRDISALTVPIPKELLPRIKELIQDFRQSVLDVINESDKPFAEVFQMNIQCFPVTVK